MEYEDRPPLRSLLTDRLGQLGIRSAQILPAIIVASLIVYALTQLKLVVIPLLIALIIAAAASPVVAWLRRRGMPALAAPWITLIVGLLVIVGVIWLIVIAVQNQWDDLLQSASDGVKQVRDFLATTPFAIDQSQLDSIQSSVVDFVTSSQFGTGALAGVSAATQVITGALLGVVILFYFLKDGDRIWNFFLRPFRGAGLRRGQRIGNTGVKVLGGYVRGTAIIAFVDAAGIGVGLVILQIPLALPLSVIVFLGGFVPLIGATIAGVLAVLVALVSNGPVAALILAAVVIGVQQLEGDLLQPVVMGKSLKLHPLVILVALTAGTILGGIVGAVVAVPLCAVTWAIIKVWDTSDENSTDASPPDDTPALGNDASKVSDVPDVEAASAKDPPTDR